jgi:hypothetical protein
MYTLSMLLDLRLPQPELASRPEGAVEKRGRIPELFFSATGAIALRGAVGFLFFLVAFSAVDALRRRDIPVLWIGIVGGGAAVGGFLGDVIAPRLPRFLREEGVVFGALLLAGGTALLAAAEPSLPTVTLFALSAGAATEFGRLAFQSLMQRVVPVRAHGRVFVRYEALFQLAWVAGAFLSATLRIPFETGILDMGIYYLVVAGIFLLVPFVPGRKGTRRRGLRPFGSPSGDTSDGGTQRLPERPDERPETRGGTS